jgi:hypothetical protein
MTDEIMANENTVDFTAAPTNIEPDTSEAENEMVIKLKKPYKFEGKEYTEIDLSGLNTLTVKDAIDAQNKLASDGERAVILVPETSTAFADALAAKACQKPLEFFMLAPIGVSRKVRLAVQKFLFESGGEDTEQGKAGKHVLRFRAPYTYKGETYHSIDLAAVGNLTGLDVRQAENKLVAAGIVANETSTNYYYCCLLAAAATGKGEDFFTGLPVQEATALKNAVNDSDFFE